MAKRRRLRQSRTQAKPKPARPDPIQKSSPVAKKQKQTTTRKRTIVVPFKRQDRILLVGDGDLSFAASLVGHHGCFRVTATVLDKDYPQLVAKYPTADANIRLFLGLKSDEKGDDEEEGEKEEEDDEEDDEDDDDEKEEVKEKENHPSPSRREIKLLYGIDATKPPPSLCRPPHYDQIIFNFPHVGGKSTDVNRQVRHNQSLVVQFFQSMLPALALQGSIIVTLFEGEPYSLWNVRDLARHAGLAVDHSFVFDPSLYPGYRHARTAGVVKARRSHEPALNPWRGENRSARSFVFRRKDHVQALLAAAAATASKKRRRNDDDDDDDDDDSNDD